MRRITSAAASPRRRWNVTRPGGCRSFPGCLATPTIRARPRVGASRLRSPIRIAT
jgi:hypothetical protein